MWLLELMEQFKCLNIAIIQALDPLNWEKNKDMIRIASTIMTIK